MRGIQLSIRHAKTVSGKNALRLGVIQHIVVPGMALCIDRLQLAPVELQPLFVIRDQDSLLVYRHYGAVGLGRLFLAINGLCSGNELSRIDHVPCAIGMNDTARVRQMLHQLTGSARMIQVHVRQKHEVDIADVQALLPECIEQQRDAAVDARVDERGSTIFDDQVTGVLQGARILRVDGRDAIAKRDCLRAQSLLRFGRLESFEARVIPGEQFDVIISERRDEWHHDRIFARAVAILIQ